MVARSYFHLNNFGQAEFEIKQLLSSSSSEEIKFEADILKAHIYFSGKDYKNSSEVYKKILETYPKKARSNYVFAQSRHEL